METGQNIQKIAKILFWVILVIGILLGIAAAVSLYAFLRIENDVSRLLFGVVALLISLAISFPLAWITECLLSGFGELVENTAVIREAVAPKPDMTPEPFTSTPRTFVMADPPTEELVCCPNCGAKQVKGSDVCERCGTKLDEGETI